MERCPLIEGPHAETLTVGERFAYVFHVRYTPVLTLAGLQAWCHNYVCQWQTRKCKLLIPLEEQQMDCIAGRPPFHVSSAAPLPQVKGTPERKGGWLSQSVQDVLMERRKG